MARIHFLVNFSENSYTKYVTLNYYFYNLKLFFMDKVFKMKLRGIPQSAMAFIQLRKSKFCGRLYVKMGRVARLIMPLFCWITV